MRFGEVSLSDAEGKILAHNILDVEGHKRFSKGHKISQEDQATLRALNYETVIIAALESSDLGENEAARRVGQALAGAGIRSVAPGVGRANLTALVRGPLRINVLALNEINGIDEGITVATVPNHTLVEPRQLIALVKIIPFAVPAARVADVETVARDMGPVLMINALQSRSVALIVSGPAHAREKLLAEFCDPVRNRIEALGSSLTSISYVSHTLPALADAIRDRHKAAHDLILLTGVSAIMDREDVAPLALQAAGGTITRFGVPVDPGSLMMIGYLSEVPVVGLPGCVKSPQTNVIDWILPRLLAGERLTRSDLIMMGHGGLLEDISDRPMPRHLSGSVSPDSKASG